MSAIAVLSPGEMGTQVATRLLRSGSRVVTSLDGRSAATVQRAEAAGIECLASLDEVLRQADLVISLVTPVGATPLARDVAAAMQRTGRRITYVEGNSISPSTAQAIGAIICQAGGEFVDGGIVGGAAELETATFYLSGEDAEAVAPRIEPAVRTSIVGPRVGQASGLKILNAGLSKGLTALGVELLLCAERLDMLPEIMARYREGRSGVADFLVRILPDLPAKARRRSQEMQELTSLMEELGLTAHTSRAAEQVLVMVAERYAAGSEDWPLMSF
ncbi:MAG TPA: NAD(P)-binding domain-containing protein [Chloroflexota bacterium]|nr:NAD(P)-binding domain-containing protein [Chloroflexota bacterium]